jgi:hypothetical protein
LTMIQALVELPETEEEILVWALEHQPNNRSVFRVMFREMTGYSVALTIADRNLEFSIISALDDWVLNLQCNKGISKNIIVRTGNTFTLAGYIEHNIRTRLFDSVRVANILLF